MYTKLLLIFSVLKYLSIIKILNFLLNNLSYLFSRRRILFEGKFKPWFISVEPSNFCQLGCPECPVGINNRKSGSKIDMDLYKKLIDELKSHLIHIIFYFQGEPLLNKKLPDMIRYAHENGIYTSTSTNGQALSVEKAKELVSSGLDKLIVSIDGATQEVYEKYRKGGSLEKAVNAVNNINYWKAKLNSLTPYVEIQFIVFGTNEHQINDMKKLSRQLNADRLVFKSAQIYNYEQGSELITTINRYSRYNKLNNGNYIIKSKLHNHCRRLWNGAVVNVNGDILPCCFDKNAEYVFGNLNRNDFNEIINNEKSSKFRLSIFENRKQNEICRNCTEK